jgi:hypothetical protein
MTEMLPAANVAEVVCSQGKGQESARICCEALRAKVPEEVRSRVVPTRHLRHIYKIRLTKPGINKAKLPLGSERLLAQLAAYNGENVRMTVVDHGSRVCCVMLDESASHLIATMVGKDRRMLSDTADMRTK